MNPNHDDVALYALLLQTRGIQCSHDGGIALQAPHSSNLEDLGFSAVRSLNAELGDDMFRFRLGRLEIVDPSDPAPLLFIQSTHERLRTNPGLELIDFVRRQIDADPSIESIETAFLPIDPLGMECEGRTCAVLIQEILVHFAHSPKPKHAARSAKSMGIVFSKAVGVTVSQHVSPDLWAMVLAADARRGRTTALSTAKVASRVAALLIRKRAQKATDLARIRHGGYEEDALPVWRAVLPAYISMYARLAHDNAPMAQNTHQMVVKLLAWNSKTLQYALATGSPPSPSQVVKIRIEITHRSTRSGSPFAWQECETLQTHGVWVDRAQSVAPENAFVGSPAQHSWLVTLFE